jgi:hypothetical protein
MIEDYKLDYATLARLLDLAASQHRHLATTSSDPVERYQASTNVEFFTAARSAATEYLTRPGRRSTSDSRAGLTARSH